MFSEFSGLADTEQNTLEYTASEGAQKLVPKYTKIHSKYTAAIHTPNMIEYAQNTHKIRTKYLDAIHLPVMLEYMTNTRQIQSKYKKYQVIHAK